MFMDLSTYDIHASKFISTHGEKNYYLCELCVISYVLHITHQNTKSTQIN